MTTTQRLLDHVDRIGAEHPPIDLATVDFTVRDPALVRERFGHVLDYMARVELEVDRNVLELGAMMPHPPEVDLRFYRDVWRDQEVAHGQVLDRLQQVIGPPPAVTDIQTVSGKLRLLGALAQVTPIQDMVRMLYSRRPPSHRSDGRSHPTTRSTSSRPATSHRPCRAGRSGWSVGCVP